MAKEEKKVQRSLTGEDRVITEEGEAGWNAPKKTLTNQQLQLKNAIALAGKDEKFAEKLRGMLESNGQLISQIHLAYKIHTGAVVEEAAEVKAPKVKKSKKA